MNEHFLHFVWKNLLLSGNRYFSTDGLPVKIVDPGTYNRDSGPDFINSRIIIDNTEWAGNVEIHYRSSMWNAHGHQNDPAYNNVILHVVAEHDREVKTESGLKLTTMEIRVKRGVLRKYISFMEDKSLIVCRKELPLLEPYFIRHWLNTLAIERLQSKTISIKKILNENTNNWEETLYILIAENFGLNVNKIPFGRLARKVPLSLISKHSDNLLQVEALLFGQAGFLEGDFYKSLSNDRYYNLLLREYRVLKSLYKLVPMALWEWKFHRMRPANFPTIRISQLAALLVRKKGLFSKVKESRTVKGLQELLSSDSSEYWHEHYNFGKKSTKISSRTGKTILDNLIINSIIPMIFCYGRLKDLPEYCDRALDLSDTMPSERNRIIREWSDFGINAASSLESQGLIQLTNSYCKNRRCLNCHIGTKLISLGMELDPDKELSLGEPL